MPTIEELQLQVQQYLQEHPELRQVLRQFQESWGQYQQYLAAVTVSHVRSDSTPTHRGSYHVNVSVPSERNQ